VQSLSIFKKQKHKKGKADTGEQIRVEKFTGSTIYKGTSNNFFQCKWISN